MLHLLFAFLMLSSAQAADWGASPAAAMDALGWDADTAERQPAGLKAYNRAGAVTVVRTADESRFLLFDASGLIARIERVEPTAADAIAAEAGVPRQYEGQGVGSRVWGRGELRLERDGTDVWRVDLSPELAQSAVVPAGFSPRSLGLVDAPDDSTPLLGREARLATAGGLTVAGVTHAGVGLGLVIGSRISAARASGQIEPALNLTADNAVEFAQGVAVSDAVGMVSLGIGVSLLAGTAIGLLVEANGPPTGATADVRRARQRVLWGLRAGR